MWSPRSRQSQTLKKGDEVFQMRIENGELTTLKFWCWAYSDLLDNATRGVLAEFLVAHALGRMNKPRRLWGAFDVRTHSGIKVEVRSAAYAQSWQQEDPSKIAFNIAPRKRAWDPETNKWEELSKPARTADVYVFCLLGYPDEPEPAPLDLSQWSFYVVAKKTLDQKRPNQKTIALNPFKTLVQRTTGGGTTPYGELAGEIERLGGGS